MSVQADDILRLERQVLGAAMWDPAHYDAIADLLDGDALTDPRHRRIWAAVGLVVASGRQADPVTLTQELAQGGALDAAGGFEYVVGLAEGLATAVNCESWARLLAQEAERRRLHAELLALADRVKAAPWQEVGALRDTAIERILSDGRGDAVPHAVDIADAAAAEIAELRRRVEAPRDVTGLPSGLADLDAITHGWEPGDMVTFGAVSGHGKTMACVQFAAAAAEHSNTHSLYVSVEVEAARIARRLMAGFGRVNAECLRTGKLTDGEVARVQAAVQRIKGLKRRMSVVFCTRATVAAIHREVRRYQALRRNDESMPPLGSVWVDYVQRIHPAERRFRSREEEVAEISRSLKDLAATHNVPVIVAAQLNREVFKRANKRPVASDLRESSAMEHDSSTLVFLHRPEMWAEEDRPGIAELIVAKARDGRTGIATVRCDPKTQRFENLTQREEPREWHRD